METKVCTLCNQEMLSQWVDPKSEWCSQCINKPHIQTGAKGSKIATYLPHVKCVNCNTRVGTKIGLFQDLVSQGYTNEEAMNKLGLNRPCCRLHMTTYQVIPGGKAFHPQLAAGREATINKPTEQTWHGNMRRYQTPSETEAKILDVESVVLPQPPEEEKELIPEGYRFIEWLIVPQEDGKAPTYVMKIGRDSSANKTWKGQPTFVRRRELR